MSNRLRPILIAMLLVFVACGDDGAEPIFGATTEVIATTAASATTAATTTAPPTTAAPATTAGPATTAAPATTAPPPTLGEPPISPIVFEPNGFGIADLGDDPASVVAATEAFFGPASSDTGWIVSGFTDYGVCPGSEYRRVEFLGGDFVLQFTDAGLFQPEGVRQLFAYGWFGGVPGPTPGPPISLDAGSTVQTIIDMYPGALIFGDDPLFGPTFRVGASGTSQLWGRITGPDPADTIIVITGGIGCGE